MAAKKKEVKASLKLIITGGQASPAPPLGPILGQAGVNIGLFTQEFNDKTREKYMGMEVNANLKVFKDGTFDLELNGPTTKGLITKITGIKKGSGTPNKEKVGKITQQQIKEIVDEKIPYLNTADPEKAAKIVEGTAKSMGIEIVK